MIGNSMEHGVGARCSYPDPHLDTYPRKMDRGDQDRLKKCSFVKHEDTL